MATIGSGWVDGAWIFAGWTVNAWSAGGPSPYSVINFTTDVGPLSSVLDALEVKMETIDSSVTIRFIDIDKVITGQYRGILIYDG